MINAYRTMGLLLYEVRLTPEQISKEAKEVIRGKHTLGYNQKRAEKAIRQADQRGSSPMSHERIRTAERGGVTQSSKTLKLPKSVRRLPATALLQYRAWKQRKLRGHIQNIPKLASDMKKDPSTIPPIVTSKKDKPGKGGRRVADKEAIEGGRTRAAVGLAVNKEPDAISIPQDRHTGSAKRYIRARLSGKLIGRENLPGQDPRLQKMSDDDLKKLKFEQRNVYRSIGIILAEALDPKSWRTWPLDPKDPKKGTLSAQNIWAQERPKDPALTNWGMGHAGKPYATRRTRVTTPATDLGIKGTKTNHTTATNFETKRDPQSGWTRSTAQVKSEGPMAIKRRTSVKGKIKNDDGTTQQVNVRNFPTRHSSRK